MDKAAENDVFGDLQEPNSEPYPEHILALMRQQKEIQKKIDEWKLQESTKKHLQQVLVTLSKKRSFSEFNPWECTMSEDAKRIKVHMQQKMTAIQQKEKNLEEERNKVKLDIEQEIKSYLNGSVSDV